MSENKKPKHDIPTILSRLKRPKKAVVTAGMPYANGMVHLGHLAGAHVPADVYARFMRMIIGPENVLFVCGTDDHGSNSEVAAKKKGVTTRDFIDDIHAKQSATMSRYSISLDNYSGTSRPDNSEKNISVCQEMLKKLYTNDMLEKKSSMQWFDTELSMFLPDRFVQGTCPQCEASGAYSEECDACGATYPSADLKEPKSSVSDATPELRETEHFFLDMSKTTDQLIEWLNTKQRTWRKPILQETQGTVKPSFLFSKDYEETYKKFKGDLPKHKSRYAPGKMIVCQFENTQDMKSSRDIFISHNIESELNNAWAIRSITRDVSWGVPLPSELGSDMAGKSFYVWPESLVAPIAFTQTALEKKGQDPEKYKDYWTDPDSQVYQFIGVDNVFFYVLMQGSMWLGSQADINRQPLKGELQLTDVFSNFHLQVDGQKMSKSKGNFYLADELIHDMGYSPDQVRYFLSILSLSEKASNFDFEVFKQRNQFLAGPLNAAFEKPISACHSKFGGVVPKGKLIGKTEAETLKIIQQYTNFMQKAEYPKALFALENYARIINSLFSQFKPHDDRHDEEQRSDALYSSFYILKNILIMLSPFVPETMERLRTSLNLDESIYSVDKLDSPFPENHKIGEQKAYFPAAEDV